MNQVIYYRLFNFITYQVYHTIGMEILHNITEKSFKFSDFMKNETDFLKMIYLLVVLHLQTNLSLIFG